MKRRRAFNYLLSDPNRSPSFRQWYANQLNDYNKGKSDYTPYTADDITSELFSSLSSDNKVGAGHNLILSEDSNRFLNDNGFDNYGMPTLPKVDVSDTLLSKLPTKVSSPSIKDDRTLLNDRIAANRSNGNNNNGKDIWTYLQYAPTAAAGLGVLSDTLGLTNKPDYSPADSIMKAASNMGQATFNPIGNYLAYKPFDREFYTNNLRSMAGASRRNILNTAGGNRGTAMAGLLASDYGATGQLGNLARQGEEFNLNQRNMVEEFNRGTNMFNSEGDLKADIANMERGKVGVEAASAAARLRMMENARVGEARSLNLTNFINGLRDIGRQRINESMANKRPEGKHTTGLDGTGVVFKKSNGGLLTVKKRRKK